jgi:hypothetical protein
MVRQAADEATMTRSRLSTVIENNRSRQMISEWSM